MMMMSPLDCSMMAYHRILQFFYPEEYTLRFGGPNKPSGEPDPDKESSEEKDTESGSVETQSTSEEKPDDDTGSDETQAQSASEASEEHQPDAVEQEISDLMGSKETTHSENGERAPVVSNISEGRGLRGIEHRRRMARFFDETYQSIDNYIQIGHFPLDVNEELDNNTQDHYKVPVGEYAKSTGIQEEKVIIVGTSKGPVFFHKFPMGRLHVRARGPEEVERIFEFKGRSISLDLFYRILQNPSVLERSQYTDLSG